jgi:hypothetical protein
VAVGRTVAFRFCALKPDVYGVRMHFALPVDVSLAPLDDIGVLGIRHAGLSSDFKPIAKRPI